MDPQQSQPTPMLEPKGRSIGPVIGLIVIIALIILGGIYFLTTREDVVPAPDNTQTIEPTTNNEEFADSAAIESQSSSDETAAIEADLEATDMSSLDSDMNELQ